jgi:hypothetical protein
VGAGAFGENIQNQRRAVDNLDLKGFFQVLLLNRRKLVIEDNDVVIGGAL